MKACALFGRVLAIVTLTGTVSAAPPAVDERPAGPLPPARRAVSAATPAVPQGPADAMQEGHYAEAARSLGRLIGETDDPASRAYFALIRGIALRAAGQLDDARATLDAAVQGAPQGPWAAKIQAELAAVHLAAGRPAEAEALARAEARALLDGDRKDRLAGVYAAFARQLLTPDDPLVPADPDGAHDLLGRARSLARGEPLRARLLLDSAAASRKAKKPGQAAREYQDYLKQDPGGADRDAARFLLGEAQLAADETLPARLTWSDLARDVHAAPDLRARALYLIARTYGTPIPAQPPAPVGRGFQSVALAAPGVPSTEPEDAPLPPPADDARLGLQVAALRRLMAAEPAHRLAVKAAFEVGKAYQARGKSREAIEAFRAFLRGDGFRAETDEARRVRDDLTQDAAFQVGAVLKGQGRLDEAVAAWRDQLTRFPNGPRSADAQRAILDARLESAAVLSKRGRFAEARALWRAFVAENPLDDRAPDVLFQAGDSLRAEGKLDEALAAFEALIGKFPVTVSAAHARFQIGVVYEQKGNPGRAVEQYRKVDGATWVAQARQRAQIMEAAALTVVTPRGFRKGEPGHLKVTTRNLGRLSFAAYKLDPEAYFRKKQALRGVESLDVGLVAPDAEWSEPVPGHARYKEVAADYGLDRLEGAGFWAVKVSDEKALRATTMVLRGDLEAVVKASREQVLVFAQDMKTGKGRAGARVLISDGAETVMEAVTGPDGVVLKDWPRPRDPASALAYLVLDGGEAAGSALTLPDHLARGLARRAYLYTDRPAYRPGQRVGLRGVVREVEGGRYAHEPGASYRLEVRDGRGRRVVARAVTLSEFGTFHEAIPLAPGAPVGAYRIILSRPGKDEFTGGFEVQAYELEKADLRIDLARTVVFRGETVRADVVARYQYGAPLAGRPVALTLPDGRTLRGTTDAAGKFHAEFPTEGFAEEQALRLTAQLPQDGVTASASLALAVRAFGIDLETDRSVYLVGESFPVRARTLDALGAPTGQALTVALLKRVVRDGAPAGEREVAQARLTTDPGSGRGAVSLKTDEDDGQGGDYVLRASGTDRFGNPVVEDHGITVSGRDDPTRLRLLADRQTFRVGEPARVNLHNRSGPGLALLAWEADRILSYRLVEVATGDNPVSWEVVAAQFPNFTLSALRLDGTRLDEGRLDVKVERDLRVTVRPARPSVGPGQEVVLEVTTADQLGKPVAAELSLAMVDRALLRLHGDALPPIGPYFHDRTRTGAFATHATNSFRYAPAARPVSGAGAGPAPRPLAVASPAGPRFATTPTEPVARVQPRSTRNFLTAEDLRRRGGFDDLRSRAILAKLDEAIDMNFPGETPFEDVMKYVKEATRGPGMPDGLPIYIDPIGLQEAEKTMTSPITFAINSMPLRTSLRIILRQLGLTYKIEDGLLTVDSEKSEDEESQDANDPNGRPMTGGMGGMGGGMGGGGMGGNAVPNSQDAAKEKAPPAGASERKDAGKPEASKKEPDNAPPPARRQFVETAYWNPAVVTGKDGKARVTFRAPSALSEYVLTARGVTGSETLAGQSTADLAVRKDLFVDFRTPPVLIQGDRPRFSARVHHSGVRGKLDVKLSVHSGGREWVDPKGLDLKADGVDEVGFDSFEVPDGDTVRLVLSARAGEGGAADEVAAEVPIRPWGVQEFATASGTSSDDTTAFLTLPPGRTYENAEMLVVISPTADRLLLDLAMGRDAVAIDPRRAAWLLPARSETAADLATDLLASASALGHVRAAKAGDAPEAGALTDRVRVLAAGLAAAQNEDGGWPWVAAAGRDAAPSDRTTSARVVWALSACEPVGLAADPDLLAKAAAYLARELSRSDPGDHAARAALLHALAARGKAGFEAVNALNRVRTDLSDSGLAYLALTLARIDRAAMAEEVVALLARRARTETAGPDRRARRWWSATPAQPGSAGSVEATALAALAFARVQPRAPELAGAVDWLLAHRSGTGWEPRAAVGPAVAALSAYDSGAKAAGDRYRLTVTVNGRAVDRAEVSGRTESRAVAVPRDALKAGGKNVVAFDVEGRGTFGYAVTLTGFTRDMKPGPGAVPPPFAVRRRAYLAAAPEFEGQTLPTGFAAAVHPSEFENPVTQVPLGGRARVVINATGVAGPGPRGYLILEEHLPAGAALVEGSVRSQAVSHHLADGVLTFYFPPDRTPESIEYELYGALTGRYRALPPRLRSADDPGLSSLGPAGELRVLAPGEASSDPYRPTPDELYRRGKLLFDSGRLVEAAAPLESLYVKDTLQPDVLKDVLPMLLYVHIATYEPRKIVENFEVVREKMPDLIVPFDKLLVIGRAYADIGEHERAYLGWRALAEASYLEDARVAEVLRQRGKPLEAAAFLIDLWREYPDEASIESDFFALAQLLASLAGKAESDPAVRDDLTAAGVSRADLLAQAARLTRAFLARSPRNPMADEASLALLGNLLELNDYHAVVRLAGAFAALYPASPFADRFRYTEALGRFHLGEYDRAVRLSEAIASRPATATETEGAGRADPESNRWQALFLLGQIHEARRKPDEALAYYRRVADRFVDAAEAVGSLSRRVLTLPEVSVVRPGAAVGPRAAAGVALTYRNVGEVEVKVYPVDLMRFTLARRGLDAVAGIDLAGVRPLIQTRFAPGGGADFEDRVKALDLPLKDEGAFLLIARSGNLYATGVVLVTPLELVVTEQAAAGLLRVVVRDAGTGDRVPDVEVRVIGSGNGDFLGGRTDLRGVFLAEGVRGQATVVARQGARRYALYRGAAGLGFTAATGTDAARGRSASLEDDLHSQNQANQRRQLDRFEKRLGGGGMGGGMGGMMGGGFR